MRTTWAGAEPLLPIGPRSCTPLDVHLLDALAAVSRIAVHQHGAFSRRQARHHGVRRDQLARLVDSGAAHEPVPGVLTLTATPDTWRRRLVIPTLAGPGLAAVTAAAALALHDIDGFPECRPEVVLPRGRHLDVPGCIVHSSLRLDDDDLTMVDGIRCTTVARALADAASQLPERRILQGLDDARRQGMSLSWFEETAARLHRPGQRGTGMLLRLVQHTKQGGVVPDSWFERLLEECLTSPSVPPIVRQHTITSSVDGRVLARVDLAMPSIRLGVEGHSRRFHFGAMAEAADEDRDLAVAEEGWHLLYLGWHAQLRPATARQRIERAVAARMRLLGLT